MRLVYWHIDAMSSLLLPFSRTHHKNGTNKSQTSSFSTIFCVEVDGDENLPGMSMKRETVTGNLRRNF